MGAGTAGERIVNLRALQRVRGQVRKRSDLARAIGMDESQLRRIETKDTDPRIETLEKIAVKGFGLPVAAIADPAYYTIEQLEVAKRARASDPSKSEEQRRLGILAFEAQLRAKRKK